MVTCLIFLTIYPAEGAWLVRRSGEARAQVEPLLEKGIAARTRAYRNLPWDVYEIDAKAEGEFAARMQRAGVTVERSGTYRLAATPNDPRFVNQTEIASPPADADIRLKEAWDVTTDTRSLTVAIIDSGIKLNHPDLAGNLWTNAAEAGGTAGVDDDGNGRVDDLHGWDFPNNSATLMDSQGHGTSVAGVVGAVGNNGLGVAGTAWGANLMILRSYIGNTTDEIYLLDALDYVLDFPEVRIVNASWGDEAESNALREAVEILGQRGLLLIAAAGNDGVSLDDVTFYPASYHDLDNVVSVAAIAQDGTRASFSNYGSMVSVAAPGSQVETTSIAVAEFGKVSGTSFSAPRVAGAAALVLARFPGYTAAMARQRLIETARATAALASTPLDGGLLDVNAALQPVPTGAQAWQAYR